MQKASPSDTSSPAQLSMTQAQEHARNALDAKSESTGGGVDSDPKHQERYTFQFDWTDKRGHRWQGTFTNQVATIYERRLIGLTRARALGGTPIASVDPETDFLIHMVAWLQITLKESPDWFADPDQLKDQRLIAELFREVASHEAAFFGLEAAQGAGQADG